MVTVKARMHATGEKHYLEISLESDVVKIPLSEDNSRQVKAAFNKLIARVKEGDFEIELEDPGEDLFSQVAQEYIVQLNREIHEVWAEIKQYGMVNE